ncbi:MAG: energy transducer TonB [Candidatus Limimorpha sp.]
MEEKKSPKANLENKRLMFAQIGLIISLAIAWAAFEIKSYDKRDLSDIMIREIALDEEMTEITTQDQKPQPPVEVPQQTTQIEIVNDDVEVEDNLDINADVTQEEIIEEYVKPEVIEEEVVEQEIFTIVETMPSFPGGQEKLMHYLATNIKYPQIARESNVQGRVYLSFVVEPDGSVSNVKVLRGIGAGCDEEAMRVVKAMPKWSPGKQRGKAVRVSYNLPVNFKLQ